MKGELDKWLKYEAKSQSYGIEQLGESFLEGASPYAIVDYLVKFRERTRFTLIGSWAPEEFTQESFDCALRRFEERCEAGEISPTEYKSVENFLRQIAKDQPWKIRAGW